MSGKRSPDATLSAAYTKTLTVLSPYYTVFSENFDTLPEAVNVYGGDSTKIGQFSTMDNPFTEGNSDSEKFAFINEADAAMGKAWKFDVPMGAGVYRVSFDFRLQYIGNEEVPYYVALGTADSAVAREKQLGLFTAKAYANNDSQVYFGGSKIDGDLYAVQGTWYQFEMVLEKTDTETKYVTKIYGADGHEPTVNKAATYTGVSDKANVWDSMLIGAGTKGAKTIIDNISIEKVKATTLEIVGDSTVQAKLTGAAKTFDTAAVMLAKYSGGVLKEVVYETATAANKAFDFTTTGSLTNGSGETFKAFA